MVAYNFQSRFAELVRTGQKTQTIRAPRKDGRHAKVGDRLQLYTGMRTRHCRKLVEPDPVCIAVRPIHINNGAIWLDGSAAPLRADAAMEMAIADGFSCIADFLSFFVKTHGYPFDGYLIQWAPLQGGGNDAA